jgi:glycosyltransferase involved in cell wall biosynthesis
VLSQKVNLHVFHAHDPHPEQQAEAGFGVEFEWDVDLLSGYEHTFLENEAREPAASEGHFFGCDTPGLYDHISADRFDAFIVNGWYLKSFWQAVWACRREGVPVLTRGDSQLPAHSGTLKAVVKKGVYPVLLRAFDGFLSVGKRFDEYLLHYGIPKERIYRAPHCVANEWFRKRARAAQENGQVRTLQRKFGGENTHILLFVGKLIPKKRPQDFVRGVHALQQAGVSVTGVCVGAGPQEEELKELSESLSANVHFPGFKNQSELPAYYALADALLLPSEGGETWGLVVNEAMACGTPAIISDEVGCGPDLILEGETGYRFPMGDVEALRDAVRRLIERQDQGHDFEAAVLNHVTNYSVESAASHIRGAVQDVLNDGRNK